MYETYEELYDRIMASTEHNIFVDYVFNIIDKCHLEVEVDFKEYVCSAFIDPAYHYEMLPLVMLYYLNYSHIDDDKRIPLRVI